MSDISRSHTRPAELLLLIVVVVWAANFPVMKFGLQGMNLFVFNSLRFLVAAVVLGSFFLARSSWTAFSPSDFRKVIGIGLLAHFVYQIAFLLGLSMTTAGNAAVLVSTAPLWTVFFESRIHRNRIPRFTWIGMAISVCGVVLIIIGSGKKLEFGSLALVGDILVLCGAALWGLYTNLQKPLLASYSAVQLAFAMVTAGAVSLTLIAIPSFGTFKWTDIGWPYYLAAIASGALSIGMANAVWSFGVKRLGPGRTSNFNNLVPVLAFIISYIVLDEKILPIQIVGAAVTVVGVWIARR